jgi:murein tripeptide amidase MpaA
MKKAIIITSRVHPGEIPASFALEGMVDFLLSDAKEAKVLREQYIFYIVPMINIDGVVHGNQRTNLAGLDLNRVWSNPSYLLSPVVYAIKNLASMIRKERKIDVFCDIHAHF